MDAVAINTAITVVNRYERSLGFNMPKWDPFLPNGSVQLTRLIDRQFRLQRIDSANMVHRALNRAIVSPTWDAVNCQSPFARACRRRRVGNGCPFTALAQNGLRLKRQQRAL